MSDSPCTNLPTTEATVGLSSVTFSEEIVGLTDEGARSVNPVVFEPMTVDPDFVTTVIDPDPDVAEGICDSSDIDGVHDVDVPTPFATVPDADPNL